MPKRKSKKPKGPYDHLPPNSRKLMEMLDRPKPPGVVPPTVDEINAIVARMRAGDFSDYDAPKPRRRR